MLRRLLRAARTDDVPLPEKDLGIASKVVDVAMHALLETAGLEHELEHRAVCAPGNVAATCQHTHTPCVACAAPCTDRAVHLGLSSCQA